LLSDMLYHSQAKHLRPLPTLFRYPPRRLVRCKPI